MADLFGFEELTNEVSERSNLQDSQPSVSQGVEEKKIFQQRILFIDASACSENQVIVPILDLTGVKKYKVLARQPVDDGPSANSSQSGASGNENSTSVSQQDSDLQKEQRKENILVTTECNHKNAVKKKLHTHKELNAPIKKSLTSKKHGTNIFKRKWLVKNKMNELKSKSKINRKLWKDKAVEYEFHSDSETKCDMATMNTGRSQSLDNRLISNEDNCRIEVTETALSSSLKPKQCIVKLRRSSSLDILSRKKVCDLKLEGVPCENVMTEKTVHELSMVENNVEKLRRADNSDALKQKQMVYDTDIDVRKSGRLKSAKCASRYRGDYGIRAQTYTKLISQKVKESIDSESDNVSGCNSFNEHAMIKSKSSSVLSRLSDSGKTAQRNPESGSNGKLFKATKAMKKHWSFSKTVPNVQEDNVKDVNSLCTTNFEESAHKLSSSEIFSLSEVPLNNPVICDKNVVIDGLPQACNKANLSGVESMLSIGCKLCCNCCHADNCDNSSRHTCAATKYVHAIGKSVHKKENQKVHVRKVSMPMEPDLSCYEGSPEKTDMDRMEGLAKLRQKLFEKAGANVEEADKTSKTFECALISSKRKEQQVTAEMIAIDSAYEQKFRTSGGCSEESEWFSNPKADLVGKEILEEVSKTLENLPKIKIGSKINQKNDLKDLVMCKRVDNVVKDDTKSFVNCSLESYDDSEEVKEDKLCNTNIKPSTRKKSQPHQKTAKCHVCDQTFKNRDLLRKHYPCRVRQTRTWVQNKLRPHRAVKRTEPAPKKFVCQLPKSGKEKSRPMLLTYRKTKFRKVKGKRRRKLYHVIQDLIQKRKAQTWPHLNVVFDDLSFKEQCMYKVGLICVGDAFQGLDNYAAEEINLFEEHRALERLVNNVSMPADIDCSIECVSYLESSAIQECETCITKQSETGTIQVFETSSQHELKTNIPQGLETSQILESEKSTTKETEFITTQESETSLTHELETSLNPDFKFGTNQEPETSTNKGSNLESSIPLSADQKITFEEQYIATKTVNGIDTQMFSQSENKQELVSSILSEIKETNVVDGSESRVKNDVEVIVEDNLNGTTEMMATNEEIINSLCACDTICKGAIHSENKPDGFLFRYVPPLTVEHTETIDIVHDSCPDSNVGYTNVEENQASTDLNKREDDMQKSHTCEADLQMTSDGHESFYFTQCDEQIVECVVDEVHIAECVVDEVLCEETSEKSYTYQDKINKNSLLEDNICQTVASNETIHATCQENSEQLSHLLEKTEKTLVQDSTKEIKIFISNENGGDDVIDDVIEPKKDNMHVKGNDVVVDVEQHNTLDDLMAILDCDGMEDGLKTTFESYGEASCLKSSYINGDSSNSSLEPTQNTQHRNIGMQHEDVGFVYCESQDRGFKNMIDDASKSSALITAYDEIANETAIKASGLKITNTISVEEMPNMEIKEDSIYSSSDANSSTSVHSTVHGSNMLSEKSHNSLKNAAPFCCADDNVKGITPYAMASIPECSQDMNSVEEALAYNGNAEIGHTLENTAVNTEFREDWIPLAPEDVLKNVWKMGVEKETYETKQSESSELCSLTNSNQFRLINESPNANIYNVEKCDTKASQIPRLNPDILQTVGLPPLKIPKKNNTSAKSSYNTGFKNAVTECNKLKKYKFEIKQVIVGTEMKKSRKMGEIKPKRHRNTRESEACEKMMIQNATESGLLKRNTLNEEAVKESNTLQNFSSSLSHTECILHKNSSISTSMSKALTETHKIKNIQTFISEEPCVASNNITNSGDERTKKAKHISLEEYMKKKGLTYHPVKPKMSEDTENTNEIKVDLVSRNEKVANEGDLHCNIVFSNEKESHLDVCKDTCEESEGLLMEGSRHELKSDHLDKDVVKQLNLYNVEDTQQFNCDEYDPESNFLLDTDGMTDDSDHSHSPDNNEAHKDACFVKNLLLAVSLIHDIVEDQREYCSANGIEIQNCNSEQGYRRQLQHSSLDQRSDSLHSDIEDSNSSSQGEEAENFSYTETLKNTYSPAATVTDCDQMEIEESGIREHQTRNEDNSEYVSKANGEFYVVEEHSTRVLSTDCKTKNSLNQSDVESHSLQEECSEPVDCIETTAEEKDFTVKYEMNGLFIKENVLTGDKNLIESLSISSSSPQSQILMETLDTNMLDDTETWSKRKKSHVDNSKCLESPEVMRKCKLNNVETSYKEKMKMKEMVADCDDINDNNVELFYESDIDDKSQNEVALVLQINTQANIEDQVKSSVQLKSPPFLEKIEDTESRSLMFEDTSSQATLLSSEPPSLKPEKKIETFKEKPDVSSSQPPGLKRSKRHFLDILENEGSCSDMLTKTSENYYDSGKKKKNTDVNENFGRHISDFISDQQAATNIELQNLFDKSEKGEVTLSEIKYLLKPPVELKRSISLATLLKVKLGLTKLLSDMEWPGKHNSSCMKKDSLSDFARRQQSDMFRKDYSTSFEESSGQGNKGCK
ncbi:hypothetical protein DPMN_011229 [Dreissena polymorpha]|uniref:Uncharacterized protein n=1 Tax=Dreissena polymorpha TaxID=45954 RepID=A0A9D4N3I7_DREPO|nr:hypothetical protein DPMN_011229 [Dreissena polymorpha]